MGFEWRIIFMCRNEEDLYRSVLSGCEDKLRQVLVENTELRRSMAQMQQELVALLHSDQPDGNHQPPQVNSSAVAVYSCILRSTWCLYLDKWSHNVDQMLVLFLRCWRMLIRSAVLQMRRATTFLPLSHRKYLTVSIQCSFLGPRYRHNDFILLLFWHAGTFEMPFDLVSEDLHKSYTAKLRKLKQVIHQVDKCNGQFLSLCLLYWLISFTSQPLSSRKLHALSVTCSLATQSLRAGICHGTEWQKTRSLNIHSLIICSGKYGNSIFRYRKG